MLSMHDFFYINQSCSIDLFQVEFLFLLFADALDTLDERLNSFFKKCVQPNVKTEWKEEQFEKIKQVKKLLYLHKKHLAVMMLPFIYISWITFLARPDEVQEELLYYPRRWRRCWRWRQRRISKMLKFYVKVFYVMGKVLSGELSCPCDRSCYPKYCPNYQ